MSRTLIIFLVLVVCAGTVVAAPQIVPPAKPAAAVLASQDGLPAELTISPTPALDKQLPVLQGLLTWTEANRPKGGGFLSSMFAKKTPSLTAEVLARGAEAALAQARRAQQPAVVSVTGVYHAVSPEAGMFPYDGGSLRLSVPAGITMQGLPAEGPDGLPVTIEGVLESSTGGVAQVRASLIKPSDWLTMLRIGRIQELMGQTEAAQKTYYSAVMRVPPSDFAAFAKVSAGRLAYDEWRAERDPDKRKAFSKKSRTIFSTSWNTYAVLDRKGHPRFQTWWPLGTGGWERVAVHKAIGPPLDEMNRNDFWYRFMDFFVALAGGTHWLGIVFLAIISRVVIWPLTKKQLASAESMKRLQPQIKALQERHTEDKQKFQEEFWKLCQANGVNPLGGCLPMLVQFPVLIALWQGIRNYIVQFQGHGFLWVRDLASPDYGLLILYTISMVAFQKMTQKLQPTPTMNAQQAQQQQMMTYMMPAMFFFFFQNFPAAFLLYWLATNLVYFAQQYSYSMTMKRKRESDGTETLPPEGKKGGFASAMTHMMSMKAEPNTPEDSPTETRSFHEKQAESRGKKVGRADDKGASKKPHR